MHFKISNIGHKLNCDNLIIWHFTGRSHECFVMTKAMEFKKINGNITFKAILKAYYCRHGTEHHSYTSLKILDEKVSFLIYIWDIYKDSQNFEQISVI